MFHNIRYATLCVAGLLEVLRKSRLSMNSQCRISNWLATCASNQL